MIEEKVVLKNKLTLLQNTWPVFFGLVGWGLKHIYSETWCLDEYKEREKILAKHEAYFVRRVEILSRYFDKDTLTKVNLPESFISTETLTRPQILEQSTKDLFMYLTAFVRNEKKKEALFRWMKAAGNLINENKKFFETELFNMKVDLEKDIKPVKNLSRGNDSCEHIVLRLFTALCYQFQTLSSTEVPNYLALMKTIKPIFEIIPEDSNGIVSKDNGLEERFLKFCDI